MIEQSIEVHETAFVTSTFRAMNEALSHDSFAKLWENEKTDIWIEHYLNEVATEDVHAHCLRNRYFLDQLKALTSNIDVLINFGAGFSMYPFLLDEQIIHIEIDKPTIVQHKAPRIIEWQKEGTLPKRDIHFIGVDFSTDYQSELFAKINAIKQNKRCFILIEGVLFFLSEDEITSIFNFFNSIQQKGDYIGSVSYSNDIKSTIAYKKLLKFFNQEVADISNSTYQTLEDSFYAQLPSYDLIDRQDYFSLAEKHKHTTKLSYQEILNENCYLLKKIKD